MIYGSGKSTGVHVSGHAYQEELKLLLTLMKPKYLYQSWRVRMRHN
ncbi:Zn-dependent hydrolase [Bacillus thuringiensis serovar israelensis ATCC 35646]|nr:Zn-dependent hydrolase [Bacillus thuringiensis serovar israelensis ATCC 35646]